MYICNIKMEKEKTDNNLTDLYEGEGGFTVHTNKWGDSEDSKNVSPTIVGRIGLTDPFSDEEPSVEGDIAEDAESDEVDDPLSTSVVTSVEAAESSVDEDTTDNPIFFMAKQAVADGLIVLNDGEDIPKDVDLGFVYNKYVEAVKPKAEQAILQEVNQRLQSAGIRDEHLPLLQAIENGVPIDELYLINKYQKYATIDAESIENDRKIDIIKEWYTERGLSEKEIKRQLEAIDINDEVDSELSEAKQFFNKTVQNFEQQQRQIAIEEQRAAEELQNKNLQILNRVLDTKEVLGDKFTDTQVKELKNFIYQRDRVISVGDQQFPASAYEEFIYRINNDLEYAIRAFKRDTFREKDLAVMKEAAAEAANADFISAYKKVQDKSSSKSSVKRGDSVETKDFYGRSVKKTPTGGTIIEFG